MKNTLNKLALATIFGFGIMAVGCQNTAEGVAEDTTQAGQAVANAGEAAANVAENTGEAIVEGTKEAGEAVANAAGNAGAAVVEGAKEAGKSLAKITDAAELTPAVKTAIVANPMLNEPGNTINVETKEKMVVLRGNVMSADLKKKAQELAQKVVSDRTDASSGYKVVNQLTIGKK